MITKFQKFKILKESPDSLFDDELDINLSFSDDDAIPFFADVNKDHTELKDVIVGEYRQWHCDIEYDSGANRAYAGRLWDDHKIMSFWIYPNAKLFKEIIERLEDKLNLKLFNNGWRIEVITDEDSDNEIIKYNTDEYVSDYFRPNDQPSGNKKIIPIEEYVGSENVPEELQIQHLLSWKEKELAKKMGKLHFKGFGSDKTAWDSPHNIKYRQQIYQEKKKN